jgi:hypothetical protein
MVNSNLANFLLGGVKLLYLKAAAAAISAIYAQKGVV